MSRSLLRPHSFGLSWARTGWKTGWSIGYTFNRKRVLPISVQWAILVTFNRITCKIWGHEWLGHAYEAQGQPSRCIHCLKLDSRPRCSSCQGLGYVLFGVQMPEGYTKPTSKGPCPRCKGTGSIFKD